MTDFLFPKDVTLFKFIEMEMGMRHVAPTLHEMALAMGLKKVSIDIIFRRLARLEEAGLIKRVYGRHRGLVITGRLEKIGFDLVEE